MSDTPRTDAVWELFSTDTTLEPDVEFSGLARQLERELNTANVEIDEKRKDVVYLATEKAKLEDRIKRLEEDSQRLNWLLNRGLAWRGCYNDWWKAGEWLYASQSALETIDEAKDAK